MDKFCIANMYKLFGLTYLMEESRDNAISCFNKAIRAFREVKSYHGQASAYYLKSLALRIKDYEDEYNNVNSEVESRKLAEKAMYMYKLLHHKEGFLKCAALCGSKENPPNKVMNLEKLQDKNYVPFVERESKFDYISLGIEPTFTIKFEEDLDFDALPANKRFSAKISSSFGRIRKMSNIKSIKIGDQEFNDIDISKEAPKESKTYKTKGLDKLGTSKLSSISSKKNSRPVPKDYQMLHKHNS